jgi:hypothetical protein
MAFYDRRMTVIALGLAVVLAIGCNSDRKDPPIEAPSLSADGKTKVPAGYETTYTFDGEPVRILYSWVTIEQLTGVPGRTDPVPAIAFHAQGVVGHLGSVTIRAPIPDQTPSLAALVDYPLGGLQNFISFANAPKMASGNSARITITAVTPTYVAGTFEAQACEHTRVTCDKPFQIKDGKFKSFRSALSDDARFIEYTKK